MRITAARWSCLSAIAIALACQGMAYAQPTAMFEYLPSELEPGEVFQLQGIAPPTPPLEKALNEGSIEMLRLTESGMSILEDRPAEFSVRLPLGNGRQEDFTFVQVDPFSDTQYTLYDGENEEPHEVADSKVYRGSSPSRFSASLATSVHGAYTIVWGEEQPAIALIPLDTRSDTEETIAYGLTILSASPDELLGERESVIQRYCGAEQTESYGDAIQRQDEKELQSFPPATTETPEATISIDVGYDVYNGLFNSDARRTFDYVRALLGGVAVIYETEVNVDLQVSNIRVWSSPDPFEKASTKEQLYAYREYVLAPNRTPSNSALHHLIKGRRNFGGIAFVNGLCDNQFKYAVSNIRGTLPGEIDLLTYHWDLDVIAHEIGHNFGSLHTHEFQPPIDCCATSEDCQNETPAIGTIMSYCHLHSPPAGGKKLTFHDKVRRTIRNTALTASCVTIRN